MARKLLLGSEAMAYAALSAGAGVITGYPTTSLARLVDCAIKLSSSNYTEGASAEWSTSEPDAVGACAATSACGLRSLAALSQEGFAASLEQIAALSCINVQGGMIILVADDPSNSQNPSCLDVRKLASNARVPMIEPSSSAEAYIAVKPAFELSEAHGTPVIIHLTQDICNTSTYFDIPSKTVARPPRKNTGSHDIHSRRANSGFTSEDGRWIFDADIALEAQPFISRRMKDIAHKFSHDEDFATYNRIYYLKQRVPNRRGKHQSNNPREKKKRLSQSRISMSALHDGGETEEKDFGTYGVCTSGATLQYVLEAVDIVFSEARKAKLPVPKIRVYGMCTPFPIPTRTIKHFLDGMTDILVLEDSSAFIEEELKRLSSSAIFLGPAIHGKLSGEVREDMPVTTETAAVNIADFLDRCMNPEPASEDSEEKEQHRRSIDLPRLGSDPEATSRTSTKTTSLKRMRTLTGIVERAVSEGGFYEYEGKIPGREPEFCAGCPHRASLYDIQEAISRMGLNRNKAIISGSIGCSLLGASAPLNAIDFDLQAGSVASIAEGFALASSKIDTASKSIAVIGDSTFFANSMQGVINAVVNMRDVTFVVLDNKACALSGLQPSPSANDSIDIPDVLHALGIENVRTVDPFACSSAQEACIKAIQEKRPSAIVFRSHCSKAAKTDEVALVNTHKCTGCKKCITSTGCPALAFSPNARGEKSGQRGQAVIDMSICNGCSLCVQACPSEAIRTMSQKDADAKIAEEKAKAAAKREAKKSSSRHAQPRKAEQPKANPRKIKPEAADQDKRLNGQTAATAKPRSINPNNVAKTAERPPLSQSKPYSPGPMEAEAKKAVMEDGFEKQPKEAVENTPDSSHEAASNISTSNNQENSSDDAPGSRDSRANVSEDAADTANKAASTSDLDNASESNSAENTEEVEQLQTNKPKPKAEKFEDKFDALFGGANAGVSILLSDEDGDA